jgi:hypothetical protein
MIFMVHSQGDARQGMIGNRGGLSGEWLTGYIAI